MLDDSNLKRYLKSYFLNSDQESYYLFLKDVDQYIRRVLLRKISNKELIEDTSQEVLIGIHNSLESFDQQKPIMPWINSIIFHKTIDFYRKQKRNSSFDQIENHELEFIEISIEDKLALKEIIKNLSSEVFGKEYLQQKLMGVSIDDISNELGLTKSNTKVVFHRLTKKVKRSLNE